MGLKHLDRQELELLAVVLFVQLCQRRAHVSRRENAWGVLNIHVLDE